MQKPSTLVSSLRRIALAVSVIACAIPATQAAASPLDWIGGERVQGSGAIRKQTRQLAQFTGVSMSVPAKMEVRVGTAEGVTIETDENVLQHIETVIENGVLKVRPAKRNTNFSTRTMKVIVTAREINHLSLGGAGTIDADQMKGRQLQVDLGGSGVINVKAMEGEALAVSVGGSGNLKVGGGNAVTVSVSIGGSGDVDLGKVKTRDATVSVAGSGAAILWASDTLSATIAGPGDVKYYGDPKVSRTVLGPGGIKRLGGAPQ